MKKHLFKLTVLMLAMMASVGQMWADEPNKNVHWQGYVWFRVPDNWDLTNYSHVQLAVARSTSIEETYIDYFGEMTRVGTTRLYFMHVNADHSSWNQNEYLFFTANSSNYGTGTFNINSNHYYTTPTTYVCNNASGCYLFTPDSEGNGPTVTGSYDTSRDKVAKKDQKVYLYTNGSESKTGGSVRIDGIYFSDDTNTGTSNVTNGSGTSATYGNVVGANVTLTATPASGYTFVGWYTAASGGDLISTDNPHTYTCKGAKDIYARFETRHTVTVNAGSNGTITTPAGGSGSTVTAGYYTSAAINASANPGYYFTNWSRNNENVTFGSSTSTASNSVTATGTATVTANFAQRYILRGSKDGDDSNLGGMAGWGATDNNSYTSFSIAGNVMTITATLTLAQTKYKFKIFDRSDSSYKGQKNTSSIPSATAWTLDGTKDVFLDVTAPGVYTFAYNFSTNSLTVTFPDTYTVTYGSGTGGSITSVTNGGYSIGSSPGYAVRGTDVTFSQSPSTGYTFKGWYTSADGNTTVTGMGTSDNVLDAISGNANVYAQYTPNVYKITFDATTNGGSISDNGSTYEESSARKIDATYDAVVSGTMPTAVKNGRHFTGWYTAADGVQVIQADGTWNQVAGYTDEDKHWIRASHTTLYAKYYDPTFLSVDFEPKYAMPESEVTATVSFNSAIGNPEGTYTLCCKLSTKSGTVLQAQPTITQDGENPYVFRFTAPSSPGEYALQVKLFPGTGDVCGGNSPIATINGGDLNYFDVEEMNPITITYECGGVELRPSTIIYATWNNRATVTAPTIAGMNFDHWEYTNCTIVGGSEGRYNGAEATFYAFTSGSAKAVYTQGSLFFKNTKNWDHVYIYFYDTDGYFYQNSEASEGTGSSSTWEDKSDGNHKPFIKGPIEMSLLEGTDDVYYFDEEINGTIPTFEAVAFTKERLVDQSYFAGPTATTDPCHVVYVNAFDANKPMIVPVGGGALWNKKYAMYYSHDLAPLLQDWGALIKSNVDSYATTHHLKSAKMGDLSFSTKIYLPRYSYSYQWILTHSGTSYGKSGYPTLTYSSPTSAILKSGETNLCAKTDVPGEYIFTVTYGTATGSEVYTGAATSDGLLKHATVTVTYPLEVGDYRLVYDDSNLDPHPSDIIKKENNGESVVSMFYNPSASPVLKIRSCTAVATNLGDDADPITWSSPTTINLSSFSSVLTEAGVYNFTITLDENGANPAVANVEKYSGRFYVRTDCVNSDKWNYKDSKDAHAMTYSDYSTTLTKKPFSHYYVKDIHGEDATVNIRFTVATDYSEAITDTVFAGDASGDYQDYFGSETLHLTQNVRFTYNQKTNKIWRAYTEGPTNDNYMVLRSGSKLYAAKEDVSPTANFKFSDMGNWVYQVDVYSLVDSWVKLTADIHNKDASNNSDVTASHSTRQYLKGIEGNGTDGTEWTEDDAVLLLGGTGASKEHMRITYDFKTDRMTTAWLPSSTVTTDLTIHADVMLLRREQEGATSIVIGEKGGGGYATLSDVEKAYGVMEFRKSYINDISLSRYERNLYWISFPFDVKLSDVFGFGKYGQHWIIEYYDGKGRAQKGFWSDSEPNWKYVTEEVKDEFTLKANEGYILALALSNMGESSSVWEEDRISSVYLYFPSSSNIGNITNIASVNAPLDSVGYKCKITRDHRDVKDSYWHCVGVPSYALNNWTGVSTQVPQNSETWATPVPYVYKWDSIYNKLSIASSSTFRFEAMKSYLIQYANDHITWTNVTNKSSIVARRRIEGREAAFREWNLNLLNNNKHMDHTYVRLSEDENVTENFDFGNDLSKEFNSGSNIYTFVDGVEVAGNVRPFSESTTIIPVGVKIADNGDYTFSMPEGTEGAGVILVDNVTGDRTNLGLSSYTVTLQQGTYNERFSLEIPAIQNTTVDIEAVGDQQADIRKVMVDGVLYIVKDGKVFDARGNVVK